MASSRSTTFKCPYCIWAQSVPIAPRKGRCRACKERVYLHQAPDRDCPKCHTLFQQLTSKAEEYAELCKAAEEDLTAHEYTAHRAEQIQARLAELAREEKYTDEGNTLPLYQETLALLREWWAHPAYTVAKSAADYRAPNYFTGTKQRIKKLIAYAERREDGVYCQGAFSFRLQPEFEQQIRGED